MKKLSLFAVCLVSLFIISCSDDDKGGGGYTGNEQPDANMISNYFSDFAPLQSASCELKTANEVDALVEAGDAFTAYLELNYTEYGTAICPSTASGAITTYVDALKGDGFVGGTISILSISASGAEATADGAELEFWQGTLDDGSFVLIWGASY